LIFGYSEAGDLRPYFSAYFDTKTGGKRDASTYVEISKQLAIAPEHIVFLSDIKEELEAADAAGFQTVQLVRAGNEVAWSQSVADFSALNLSAL
jgi:enolase-phosphatase E1